MEEGRLALLVAWVPTTRASRTVYPTYLPQAWKALPEEVDHYNQHYRRSSYGKHSAPEKAENKNRSVQDNLTVIGAASLVCRHWITQSGLGDLELAKTTHQVLRSFFGKLELLRLASQSNQLNCWYNVGTKPIRKTRKLNGMKVLDDLCQSSSGTVPLPQ